jgi:hypothetical protein
MIGFDFLLGWFMINICLIDLLDLRYNKERSIVLIPSIVFTWVGKGKSRILTLIVSWLNLEFNIIVINFDYYCDKLEDIIEQMERFPEDNDKEE